MFPACEVTSNYDFLFLFNFCKFLYLWFIFNVKYCICLYKIKWKKVQMGRLKWWLKYFHVLLFKEELRTCSILWHLPTRMRLNIGAGVSGLLVQSYCKIAYPGIGPCFCYTQVWQSERIKVSQLRIPIEYEKGCFKKVMELQWSEIRG